MPSLQAPAAVMVLALLSCAAGAEAPQPPRASVDDTLPVSLTGVAGDAERGRGIVSSRQTGLCLLCHAGPFPDAAPQGNLGPSLAGVGSRYTEAQLRLRVALPQRLNPESIMPAYLPSRGRAREGAAWRGRPVLTPQQIEDVVAFLTTLRE